MGWKVNEPPKPSKGTKTLRVGLMSALNSQDRELPILQMYKNENRRRGRFRVRISTLFPAALAVAVAAALGASSFSTPTIRPKALKGTHQRVLVPPRSAGVISSIAYSPVDGHAIGLTSSGVILGGSLGNAPKLGPDAFGGGAVALSVPDGVKGYYVATGNGDVYAYGAARWMGSPLASGRLPAGGVVALAARSGGRGYYVLGANGEVLGFGTGAFRSHPLPSGQAAAGLALAGTGQGYYVATSTGAVIAYNAAWHGQAKAPTPAPVVGIAVDQHTGGYWLALADGQVLGFDAPSSNVLTCTLGSQSVSAIAATPNGYLLGTSGGQILPVVAQGGPNRPPSTPPCLSAWRATNVVGFYPGTGMGAQAVSKLGGLETWVGHPVGYVVEFLDQRSPAKFSGSAWGLLAAPGGLQSLQPKPRLVLSVPLGFSSGPPSASTTVANFSAVASGRYDSYYHYVAHLLLEAGYPDAIIRIGWEFNGNWFPWSASYDPGGFKSAYRHVVDVFRGVSPTFRYDLSASAGIPAHWSRYWPGSSYVNILGLDLYDRAFRVPYNPLSGTWASPSLAWSVAGGYLNSMETFAVAHHKVVSLPEWGLSSGGSQNALSHGGDDPTFILGVVNWIESAPGSGPGSVLFATYFNADVPSEGSFELSSFPRSAAVFRRAFGGGS